MDLIRRELKYRITPEQIPAIRDVVRRHCSPDRDTELGGYLLSSLYFDTPSLRCYRDFRDRQPVRFKMRVRRYLGDDYHLEVKARDGLVFHKTRATVPEGLWPAVLRDPRALPGRPDIEKFLVRLLSLGALPSVLVRYRREAWTSTIDDYARVTFDHRIEAALPIRDEVIISDSGADWVPVDRAGRFGLGRPALVLELKCERGVPRWMLDVMQSLGLKREGFSKYAAAIEGVRAMPHAPDMRRPAPRWWGR